MDKVNLLHEGKTNRFPQISSLIPTNALILSKFKIYFKHKTHHIKTPNRQLILLLQ